MRRRMAPPDPREGFSRWTTYDGHTLEGQLDWVERLTSQVPATTFVGKGYKGQGVDP